MLKPTIFREYDIRGIADLEMLSPDVVNLGRAIGTYMRRHSGPKVALGRDVRLSGTRLHAALLEGLLASGCDVTDIGIVPTPVLYFSVHHLHVDAGVMITGSHNPAEYNGFKMMTATKSVFGAAIQEIHQILLAGEFSSGAGGLVLADAVTPYVDEVAAQFSGLSRRVKVVIDAGNAPVGR